jgi:hypothetical protein
MTTYKTKLGLLLFAIGMCGVFSMLLMDISALIPAEISAKISPDKLKFIMLGNPTIILILMIVLGLYTHEKANLAVPQLQSFLTKEPPFISFLAQAKIGILGGILAGILILAVTKIITPYVSAEYIAMGEKMNPPVLTRFLYGGLLEEIYIRFGLMSGLVLLFSKISKNLIDTVYWAAISVAAILFGMGHLPLVFQLNPNPSMVLVGFIIVGNSLAGLIFGYLYWKKGLEAAFVAHIFAHVTMLAAAAL